MEQAAQQAELYAHCMALAHGGVIGWGFCR